MLSMQQETHCTHKTIPDKGKGGKLVQEHALGGLPGRVWVAILDTLLFKGNVKPPVGEGKQWQVTL